MKKDNSIKYLKYYKESCEVARNYTDRVYIYRDKILKKNGYGSYKDYLLSDHWKQVKLYVKDKWCHCCGSTRNLSMHHKKYTKTMMEIPKVAAQVIVAVCQPCHDKIHIMSKESKYGLTIKGAEKKLRKLNGFNLTKS